MGAESPPSIPVTSTKTKAYSWMIKGVMAVMFLAFAGLTLYFILRKDAGPEAGTAQDTWVSVATVEIASLNKAGKAWDVDKSGPDVFYEIWWKGNRVYKSSVCTDALIAKWDSQEINVGKLLRTNRIEASRTGAIVNPATDSLIVVKILDSDVTVNDPIDEYKVDLTKMKPGSNELGPGPQNQCLKLRLLLAGVAEE